MTKLFLSFLFALAVFSGTVYANDSVKTESGPTSPLPPPVVECPVNMSQDAEHLFIPGLKGN